MLIQMLLLVTDFKDQIFHFFSPVQPLWPDRKCRLSWVDDWLDQAVCIILMLTVRFLQFALCSVLWRASVWHVGWSIG